MYNCIYSNFNFKSIHLFNRYSSTYPITIVLQIDILCGIAYISHHKQIKISIEQ